MKTPVILVADQDARGVAIRKQLLVTCGYEVHTADTASEAMRLIRSTVIDLVLLDYALADESGNELARQIRTVQPHLPIVMLSSALEPVRDAVDRFIVKGSGAELLLQTIREFVK